MCPERTVCWWSLALAGALAGCDAEMSGAAGPPLDADQEALPADLDGDGHHSGDDCDDGDSSIHPGAVEVCGDGIDNDCSDPGDHPGLGVPGDAWCACESTGGTSTPKGLFMQVSTLGQVPDRQVHQWLSHICRCHKDPAAGDYIDDLLLQDVADGLIPRTDPNFGRLLKAGHHSGNQKLDVIDDYFGCFDNLFVGTIDLPHPDKYWSGIQSADFRWDNIDRSTAAMDDFMAAYPGLTFHWYLSYEANLNYFTSTALRDAYVALNLELVNRFNARRPSAAILWSPTWWTRYGTLGASTRSALIANLDNHFGRVAAESALGRGIDWLHFQDHVGVECDGFTSDDAIGYHAGILQPAHSFASLRVNMEHFQMGCDWVIHPADPAELQAREAAYRANALPVGISWEVRYWYPTHRDL